MKRELARVTEVVSAHQLNIDSINRLSGRLPLGELPALSKACVEFSVRGDPLHQTATFRPQGLLGRLYWLSVLPAHWFLFPRMARALASGS